MPRTRPAPFPAPLRQSRFPWLMVVLCAVLSLAFGGATAGLLLSPRPETAALFGLFFLVALGGFVWFAEREEITLCAEEGVATLRRRNLLRRRRIVVPLAEVNGLGVESKRIRSKRSNADTELYTDINRPVLFAADGTRHVIFKTHRGGEWANNLAREGNDWLARWRERQAGGRGAPPRGLI